MDFSAVSSALKAIGELTQQVTSLLGVDGQVESLETELRWMQSFLEVADARKVDNPVIRTSVAKIRELAYDVEDVIETFALKVASKRKGGFSNCIKRSACFLREGEGPSSSTERREARRPFPHKMDDSIVGMDGDINKLVSVLVEEGSEYRVVSISGMDRRGHLHELQCLSDEHSWDLFQKIAFPRTGPTENRVDAKLKKLGEEMVKHCAGLPLAIVALGGILVTKDNSLTEWLKVSANVKSDLRKGKSEGPEDVLALSYDDMPPYLRPCFLYLSHFPEDYEISVDRLIQLWVAEGFVSSNQEERDGGEIAEDVAESYLMELVARCMVQVRKRDVKIKTIQMHDLIRDLCLSKAKQESFVFIVDQSNASSLSIIPKVRRVSLHKFCWIQCIKSSNLRSLFFFDEFITEEAIANLFPQTLMNYVRNERDEHWQPPLCILCIWVYWQPPLCILCIWVYGVWLGVVLPKILGVWRHMCNNFRLLRVLDCEGGSAYGGCKLSNDIGNLIHLRFLSLRGLKFMRWKLPSSLGNLRCLQTLDLRLGDCIKGIHVPNVIWRIQKLRHLYLPDPDDCSQKTKLKLATLTKLQTLVNFNSETCYAEDLINMTNLRKLKIRGPFKMEDMNNVQEKLRPSVFRSPSLRVMTDTSIVFPSSSQTSSVPVATSREANMDSLSHSSSAQDADDGVRQTPTAAENIGASSTPAPTSNAQGVSEGVNWTYVAARNIDVSSTVAPTDVPSTAAPSSGQNNHASGQAQSCDCASSSGSSVDVHELQCGKSGVNDGPSQSCDAQEQNTTIPVSSNTHVNKEELDKNPPIIEGRYLHSLSIISDGGIDPRHLNHLLSSCLSLCKLSLDVEIGEVPKYDHLSSDLAYITLSRCNLEEDPMPTLEKLPNLRNLELYDKASRANKMCCSAQGFPKLESLCLSGFFNLEELNVDEGAMSCLGRLEIDHCQELKMAPDGLRFITSLQEVKIERMKKAFKDRVEEGGEDFYKVQHVPSIIFWDCHY
ncbi:hypothetical protein V6N12_023304 [Hibiscus sabdariffa]|uniref:Uncharacterized protein n=1 Tax=Hibiscus sabdariffa TaxID=183260 RepID=A0ABR2FXG3_9ROSI